MDLSKMFEAQRELDEHIEREHPRRTGEDRLAKKILALLVELGELVNEWRGFKFWSNDQEPRTRHLEPDIEHFDKTREARWIESNPLLEEYVDCLHFILSIGNEINMNEVYEDEEPKPLYCEDIIDQFIVVNDWVNSLYYRRHEDVNGEMYDLVFAYFLGLGEMLGFTWEEVEKAYFEKNAVNHERQESGY
ncbi:dUTP diphosphatase [Caenibacillus caldisaponilyticus]|uniref:dUTP diphosphatase n=1 Tax=Caenibacillus caldisaponilyticus TaxID=1674942 RepID=UPI000988765B|nr:dUTP diphosphatase [Caenibacillus caldisaponilyticus]